MKVEDYTTITSIYRSLRNMSKLKKVPSNKEKEENEGKRKKDHLQVNEKNETEGEHVDRYV